MGREDHERLDRARDDRRVSEFTDRRDYDDRSVSSSESSKPGIHHDHGSEGSSFYGGGRPDLDLRGNLRDHGDFREPTQETLSSSSSIDRFNDLPPMPRRRSERDGRYDDEDLGEFELE